MVSLLTAPVARDWLCRLLAALLFCLRPGSAADRLRALAEASGETAGWGLSHLASHLGALNREPNIKSVLVVAPKSYAPEGSNPRLADRVPEPQSPRLEDLRQVCSATHAFAPRLGQGDPRVEARVVALALAPSLRRAG